MFDKALLRLSGMKRVCALLAVSALVQAALVISQALALSGAIADLWLGEPALSQLPPLAAFVVLFSIRRLVALVQDERLDAYARKQASALRSHVLGGVFGGDASIAHRLGTASTAISVTDNLDDVERYVRVIPPKLFGIAFLALPVLVALFAIDWVSGVISLVALPVIVFFMIVLGRQAKARAERQFAESATLSNRFIDALRGLDSILALGAGGKAAASIYDASEKMRVSTVRTLSIATLSSAVLDLVTVFGIAAIAMMLAFRLLDGSMSLEAALPAFMLAPEYFAPIRSFASDFHASLDGRTALASILELIDGGIRHEDHGASRPFARWSASSTLEARSISLSYDDGSAALHDASFSIGGFSKIGIVGVSGSGKSTLADLLAGFRKPSSGTFAVNGEDVDLTSPSWRGQVHYVPQHPHVFHATLRENIALYADSPSDDEIDRAVRAAGLEQVVSDLPHGLDTVIGESGRSLSGGEAQRVAIARILLGSRDVLVFDEPTAHLDIETELELKQRLLACMENRLTFFATHRLHWLADMDYIIVLEDGCVREAGTPGRLLESGGVLSRLAHGDERGGAR